MAAIRQSALPKSVSTLSWQCLVALLLACTTPGVLFAQQATSAPYPVPTPYPATSTIPASHETTSLNPSLEERIARLEEQSTQTRAQLTSLPPVGGAGDAAKDGYVVGSDPAMTGKFTNDGAVMQSKNNDFKYHVRGVSQLDMVAVRNPGDTITVPGGVEGTKDSVDFRRLRFGAEGTMYEVIDWVFELDFAFSLQNFDARDGSVPSLGLRSFGGNNQGGNVMSVVQPTTINMTFKEMPFFGNCRIGTQPSWIGLEHIESARFLDFMERSPLQDAFNGPNNNGYAPGITFFNTTENKMLAWQYGAYKNTAYDSGYSYNIGNNNYAFGGRVTGTPYYDELTNGRYLVHMGFGSEARIFDNQPLANTGGTNVRVRTRGDVRNTPSAIVPNFTDTGNFYAENQVLLAPEFVVQAGPWLWQTEYEASLMGGAAVAKGGVPLDNVVFQGGYSEVLYFLTGENRDYNRTTGTFGRVVPLENAYITKGAGWCGKGAWQAGVRYDWMCLNSGLVNGGYCQNLTFGLNWFLNPNLRFQLNYVHAMIDNAPSATFPGTLGSLNGSRFVGDGSVESLGLRMDFNF